ncbi:MAG: hypothetical protein MZV63_53155 [Marinilabiliales bacterium]|nr:hypothetical protein [Marinilabiliales bacterium]
MRTADFVDIYKAWSFIAQRSASLRRRSGRNSRAIHELADIFTPLVKLITSEWCNLRSPMMPLQVHGRSRVH